MKLIEQKPEFLWDRKIGLELTVEEFAILLSCLWVTHPYDALDMSKKHLGRELSDIDGSLGNKMYDMTIEGTELFKKL